MTGCTQKESGKEISCFDEKVTAETVELATCDINVGGIRFTKSKTALRMASHFLATPSSSWPVPKLTISVLRMEASSIVLPSFSQRLTTPSRSLLRLKYSRASPKPEHIRPVCYTHTKMTRIVRNYVSSRMNMAITAWCQSAQ